MWNTHFGRTWMWGHLILYARISCMVLTSPFGTIHTNGLHHSLELSALTGECPCSQRKAAPFQEWHFQAQTSIWKRAQGPPEVHCSCFSWGSKSNPSIQRLHLGTTSDHHDNPTSNA